MSNTPTYRAWQQMKVRVVRDPHDIRKNITVCERWLVFENFLADMSSKPPGRHISLGRIDNDGNYEPGNVEWQNARQQNSNKGNNVLITSEQFGTTKTLTEWNYILIEQTADTTWTPKRLTSTLKGMKTIDRILQGYGITDLTTAECADDQFELIAA